jgi:hypothetical protein
MKKHLHQLIVLSFIFLLTACPFEGEEETPEDTPRLTQDFLCYKDINKTIAKVWFCSGIDVTYFKQDGSVDKIEELKNYQVWDMRFSEPGPYSDKTLYLIRNTNDVWNQFMPTWGRYVLNSSKNEITFGNINDPLILEDRIYEDISFEVTFREESYRGNWMKFTHREMESNRPKREISFTLTSEQW